MQRILAVVALPALALLLVTSTLLAAAVTDQFNIPGLRLPSSEKARPSRLGEGAKPSLTEEAKDLAGRLNCPPRSDLARTRVIRSGVDCGRKINGVAGTRVLTFTSAGACEVYVENLIRGIRSGTLSPYYPVKIIVGADWMVMSGDLAVAGAAIDLGGQQVF